MEDVSAGDFLAEFDFLEADETDGVDFFGVFLGDVWESVQVVE